jgi:hypothetical protein
MLVEGSKMTLEASPFGTLHNMFWMKKT